ncbi:MAG TPA: dTDP-4-dehydrorhamnose reductase [Candidatus Wallbacteria bacterium]|nr:dTDP-4-dehydrorhamnose reductase [Candidatus Wallbacteria bacterium]
MDSRPFKILVTGSRGMLGADVLKSAGGRAGIEMRGVDLAEFDLLDAKAAAAYIRSYGPDAIIHCAAFTNVDAAETRQEEAFKINAMAVRDLAVICAEGSIKLALISTDYVFDGEKRSPYAEYDQPSPINIYGMSKYYAERYVAQVCPRGFIVRTSWLFGANGNNFVKAILKKARSEGELFVVDDQFGSPTYTGDLAKFLIELVQTDKYGIYHATNEGYCSWNEFARVILKLSAMEGVKVNAVSSEAFKRPAVRPKNSRLLKTALHYSGFKGLRPWQEALADYLAEIGEA